MKVLIVILAVLAYSQASGQNADIDLLRKINHPGSDAPFWVQVSNSAYWIPAAYLVGQTAYTLFDHGKAQGNGWGTLTSVGIGLSLSELIKIVRRRERPYNRYPLDVRPYKIMGDSSFPSGHTTAAFTIGMCVFVQYGRWYAYAPALAWAASVGYSRMYLGEHYPSDVLTGMLLGSGSAWLGNHLINKR